MEVKGITRDILVVSGLSRAKTLQKISPRLYCLLKRQMEKGEAFRFKTPTSILVVGPSGCGKTCFTKSLLLDHSEELLSTPPETIHYCYGVWPDGFRDMQEAGVQFDEGVPSTSRLRKWFPNGGFLVLDELMTEGSEDKELLDLFTKHSHHQNITVLFLCQDMFPPGKYVKSILGMLIHHSLQECSRPTSSAEFTASSLSHLLARHNDGISESGGTIFRVLGLGSAPRQ